MDASDLDARCPVCNTESTLILNDRQALCVNELCNALIFNPSLPDGGMVQSTVVER